MYRLNECGEMETKEHSGGETDLNCKGCGRRRDGLGVSNKISRQTTIQLLRSVIGDGGWWSVALIGGVVMGTWRQLHLPQLAHVVI